MYSVIGLGPLSWLYTVEILPWRSLEIGLSFATGMWWTFNLVFAASLKSVLEAVGASGLFFMHAVVCALTYGFALHLLPDIKGNSLMEIEHFYKTIDMVENGEDSSDNSSVLFNPKFRFSFRSNASSNTNL